MIELELNVLEENGASNRTYFIVLKPEQIADVIDHARQLIIAHERGQDFSDILPELKDALEVYNLLPELEAQTPKPG